MIKSSRLSPRFYVGEEPGYEANVFGQSEFYILGAMGKKDPMHMFPQIVHSLNGVVRLELGATPKINIHTTSIVESIFCYCLRTCMSTQYMSHSSLSCCLCFITV